MGEKVPLRLQIILSPKSENFLESQPQTYLQFPLHHNSWTGPLALTLLHQQQNVLELSY